VVGDDGESGIVWEIMWELIGVGLRKGKDGGERVFKGEWGFYGVKYIASFEGR
jgi:hypothetical protein